jgi:hypothetical protein
MALSAEQQEIIKATLPDFEVTEDTTIEDYKTALGEKMISIELHDKEVKASFGRARGEAESKMKKLLGSDGTAKSFDELVPLVEAKVKALDDSVKQLQTELKGSGKTTEEIEKIKKEAEDLRTLLAEKDEAFKAKELEVESVKASYETKESQKILTDAVTSELGNFPFIDTYDKYAKNGWYAEEIAGNYAFKMDGKKILVFNLDGSIVKNGTNQMEFKDLLDKKAIETKVKKLNGAKTPTQKAIGDVEKTDPKRAAFMVKMAENAAAFEGK